MRRTRGWLIVALVFGSLSLLAGLTLVGMYVFSAIIEPLGEPDQSLLFWLMPFLLVGVGATVLGVVLIAVGVTGIRRH